RPTSTALRQAISATLLKPQRPASSASHPLPPPGSLQIKVRLRALPVRSRRHHEGRSLPLRLRRRRLSDRARRLLPPWPPALPFPSTSSIDRAVCESRPAPREFSRSLRNCGWKSRTSLRCPPEASSRADPFSASVAERSSYR